MVGDEMTVHEAILKVQNACRLLEEALEQLPKNHPTHPFLESLKILADELLEELEKDVQEG